MSLPGSSCLALVLHGLVCARSRLLLAVGCKSALLLVVSVVLHLSHDNLNETNELPADTGNIYL